MDDYRIRARWAWAFHLGRILVVVWAAWHLWHLSLLLSDRSATLQHIGKAFETDLAGVSDLRYVAAVAVSVVVHVILLFFCIGLWRLFTLFLAGRLFTVETACQMRMVGLGWPGADSDQRALSPSLFRCTRRAAARQGAAARLPEPR